MKLQRVCSKTFDTFGRRMYGIDEIFLPSSSSAILWLGHAPEQQVSLTTAHYTVHGRLVPLTLAKKHNISAYPSANHS